MPAEYRVRPATLADVDVLVRHRIGMFSDMGVPMDVAALDAAYRAWLSDMMPAGTYRGWLAETSAGEAVSGGGVTVLPWPPGPTYPGDRLAFVYNVYTEPPHRRRAQHRYPPQRHRRCPQPRFWFPRCPCHVDGCRDQ